MLISLLVLKLLYGTVNFFRNGSTERTARGIVNTIEQINFFFDNSYSTCHQNGNIQYLVCCIVRIKEANLYFVTLKHTNLPFFNLTMPCTSFFILPFWCHVE